MIRLRLYRAIDDPDSCQKFIVGHRHVLENIGVTKVTSSQDEWMHNPDVYVLIVEDTNDARVLGGARVHIASATSKLPIEAATSYLDSKVTSVIESHIPEGTGEICGLWNSREVAGMGIGSVFLTRAAVAISEVIGLQSLFALCAPYTVKMAQNVGFRIEERVGNKGAFYYPKLDLIATFMMLPDVPVLSTADDDERGIIMKLRGTPVVERIEKYRNRDVHLYYQLTL